MQIRIGEHSIAKELQAVAILHRHGLLNLIEAYQQKDKRCLREVYDEEQGFSWEWEDDGFYWFVRPLICKKRASIRSAKLACMEAKCFETCKVLRELEKSV